MKRLCLALFLAAALAPAAPACANDREIVRSEQEFKSRYLDQQPPPPSSAPSPGLRTYSLFVTGAVLLLGAFVVSRPDRR
jgi:hypothetical protein